MSEVRAYGIFVHGKENIEKLKARARTYAELYAYPVLLQGEVVTDALMVCSMDEFDRIHLSGVWPNWQCRKWLRAEFKEWEERPSKDMLKQFVKDAKLIRDKHTVNGHQFYEGPDWFIFTDKERE